VNDHLMELLIMIDACRRASARQNYRCDSLLRLCSADRKTAGGSQLPPNSVANLNDQGWASRVLAIDLHSAPIQGYFDIPCDHVYGTPVLIDYIASKS
jgi:ribose-phosphate pyrophosphokinase